MYRNRTKQETHNDVIHMLEGKVLIHKCKFGASHSIKIRGMSSFPTRSSGKWCQKFYIADEGLIRTMRQVKRVASLSTFRKYNTQFFHIDDSARDGCHNWYLDNEFARLHVIAC